MSYTVEIDGVRYGPFATHGAALAFVSACGAGRRAVIEPLRAL